MELRLVGTEVPFLVANVLALILGVLLLVLQGSRRSARIFGFYLLLRSVADASVSLAIMAGQAGDIAGQYAFLHVRVLGLLATPFLLLALAANYPRQRGVFSRPLGLFMLAAVGLISWLVYLAWPASVEHLVLSQGQWSAEALGPLAVLLVAGAALEAALAAWFLWIYWQEPPGARRRVVGVFVLGFGAQALFYGAQAPRLIWDLMRGAITYPSNAFLAFQLATDLLAFLALVVFAVLGFAVLRRDGWPPAASVLVIPFVGALLEGWGPTSVAGWATVFQGISWLILPAFATYALLRHTLFDLDVRLRWTIQQGTLASIFLAVFFIVSAGASEFLIDQFGYTLGAVAVGLMFFIMRPLQAFAERVAKQALPAGGPMENLGPQQRVALYRDQVELAWQDGTIGTKERAILRNLRDRLGIDLAAAAQIEDQVTGA